MSQDKLTQLVAGLKAERKQNPFNKPGIKTRIFAIASGKGGVGKSSVTANLAATFAALGYDTAAIDADIYGFSLPRLFGVQSQPTNLNGMLMPVTAWGVKLISIGMFAGADRASYGVVQDCNAPWNNSYPTYGGASRTYCCSTWRPAPATWRFPWHRHCRTPNWWWSPHRSIRLRHRGTIRPGGIAGADEVRGVVENMSYYEHKGEKLRIFGEGGGARVSEQLTHSLGYEVPLLAQLPLEPELRETGEAGRPAVLTKEGALRSDGIGETFKNLAESLMRLPQ